MKEPKYTDSIQWRLRLLMGERQMTQEALALEIGASHNAVGNWCRGLCYPAADRIVDIANVFGVSCDFVLGQTTRRERLK